MIIMASADKEQELQIQQLVLEAFSARLAGEKDYTLDESKSFINKLIEGNNYDSY